MLDQANGATNTVEAFNDAIAALRNDPSVTKLPGLSKGQDTVDTLINDFLTPSAKLSAPELARSQVHWQRKPKLEHMLWAEPSTSLHSLEFVRAGLEGRIVSYKEVSHTSTPLLDSKSSASMARKPATSSNFVRGKSAYVPFAPGGLENEVMKTSGDAEQDANDLSDTIRSQVAEMEDTLSSGRGLRSKAPGLSRSFVDPNAVESEDEKDVDPDEIAPSRVRDASQAVDVGLGMAPIPVYRPIEQERAGSSTSRFNRSEANGDSQPAANAQDAELDELLPVERPQPLAHSRRSARIEAKRDWAHVVDVNQKLTNFHELVPQMAHSFPFELDTFQKEAVYHLEQGDSVFVAAHTSAGKTVVAEYAIALAQKHMTRCIYTSPIKALSNQKYRDFKQTFGAANVGILTGDVQINPEAPCLIMTTEILRSMLYRGADLIRDVEFVIFDEVHYVNDQERGVVWEEVIILCPQHINLILLSATVPNTKEFADWVGRTKKKDIYVISTPKRPVPLEHFLYAGKEMFKIVDARAQFLGSGIKEAGEALKRKQEKEREANAAATGGGGAARGGRGGGAAGSNSRGRGGMTPARGAAPRGRGGAAGAGRGGFTGTTTVRTGLDKNLWIHLVGNLRKKDLLPCVVFVFSKKRCEEYATSMPNTDLNTAKDKSEVHIVIEKSLTRLKGTDKELPQIKRMRDLLSRGIGVHHGGLLPIVKEIVELLFQRGLVKVLFATETFAMGVNMPARSVVFSSIRKHDGHGFRELLPGEYTQMSGRAGRRGLDATGVVIINAADQLPETAVLHKMLLGQPTKLQSQFRLTYNMILNLLRVEALKVEEMIKRSFSENAAQKMLPDQQRKAQELEKKLSRAPHPQPHELDDQLSTYYDLCAAVVASNQSLFELALGHQQGAKNFGAGRVVVLRDGHFDFDVAVIVRQVSSSEFLVLAAVTQERKSGKLDWKDDKADSTAGPPPLWPPRVAGVDNPEEQLVYDLREVPLNSISFVTDQTIKLDVPLITAHRISAMNRALSALVPIRTEFSTTEGALKEAEWSKLRRLDFQEAVRSRDSYASKTSQHLSLLANPDFHSNFNLVSHYKSLTSQLEATLRLSSDENLELLPDYNQRVQVLKTLRYIDPITESVLLKGRVACEVNSANELVLTELILENVLVDYEPEELIALLSIFITQEKTDDIPILEGRLLQGYEKILEIAERVSTVQLSNHLASEDFSVPQKTALAGVVYEWAKGTDFASIAAMTDIQEGSIVRVITRLDETCREIRDAARVIGDRDLGEKIQTCQTLIRRDIVFAASLYF